MKEQLLGLLWMASIRTLGPYHRLSLALESRWAAAYWATRPPLRCDCQHCLAARQS